MKYFLCFAFLIFTFNFSEAQFTKDDFADSARKHTASKHVQIIDTAFFMPQLNRTRRIWIYLPEGYESTKKQYPVLYMQDAQNIFDASTAAADEWAVDECLDSLIASGKQPCIVVGIDNGGDTRMSEYNPYEFVMSGYTYASRKFNAEGNEYLNFLSETLKPFIDKKYRTLASKENTIIAGSSMGGLISYYATIKEPQVFGKAGIFSPAFWTAPYIKHLTNSLASKINGKFFFYIGEQEGDLFVKDMQDIQESLAQKSAAMIYSVVDEDGIHNEAAWRKWFPEFYCWIMADGFNNVIKVE